MFGYHVPGPSEVLIITGKKSKSEDGTVLPARIVRGSGTFVIPVIRKVERLSLGLKESLVENDCVTTQGIALRVRAIIAFKVGSDMEFIATAAERFASKKEAMQMETLTGQIFDGHLRSIVGSMTVEAIIRERQTLAEQVLLASKREMAGMGLVVESFQIQGIDDKGSGYIEAFAAPERAAVKRNADIAQAEADQLAAEAQQRSIRAQAGFQRETVIAQALIKAETDAAQAEAAAKGPLAEAQARQAVLQEQSLVAQKNAQLREAELVAEIIKPAQAEAARVRIQAEAAAAATRLAAEAAASEGRIALDQQLITLLPQMIQAAAQGLNGANVTVLNGATGLNEAIAALAGQGLAILQSVKDGLPGDPNGGSATPAKRTPPRTAAIAAPETTQL